MPKTRVTLAAICCVGFLFVGSAVAEGVAATTTRVSLRSNGDQGNDASLDASISAGGRFVAFSSSASNLVPGDTNGAGDVFVHDGSTDKTTRVSVRSNRGQGNDDSFDPSISADGRFVSFTSYASNLVPGDTNGATDVFVHDRMTGRTTRVSVSSSGIQGGGDSFYPSLSANGRFVSFTSFSNLVADDTNDVFDVFVHDRETGLTTRVSVRSNGDQGNNDSGSSSISAAGRFVSFESSASNLIQGDTNDAYDVFVHDRETGHTTRVSVRSNGDQGDDFSLAPSSSANGRFVSFYSVASNLVPGDTNGTFDVFVHDRRTGLTTRVSVRSNGDEGNDDSRTPSISADGRFVAFRSHASDLVAGDTNGVYDTFVHDRTTGHTTRVSVSSNGIQGNADSFLGLSISADGRFVAFDSFASNLVPGDTNGVGDVFVRGPLG
jgi:archaellum component FlaF (FlaF/FlaG flagellin family)